MLNNNDPLASLPPGLVEIASIPSHPLPPESATSQLVASLVADLRQTRSRERALKDVARKAFAAIDAQRQDFGRLREECDRIIAQVRGLMAENLRLRSRLDQAEARRTEGGR